MPTRNVRDETGFLILPFSLLLFTCLLPRLQQITLLRGPARDCKVGPLLDLCVAIVFSIPVRDVAGAGEPYFCVALRVANKLAQQRRAKRPAADERVIAPDQEFGIALSLLIKAIKRVFPHLQEVPGRSPGALITGIVVQV